MLVVIRRGGEYDSQWEEPILVTPSQETADRFIADRKAEDVAYSNILRQIREFEQKWYEQNPLPEMPRLEASPRWPAGLGKNQITDEMKRERQAVKDRNALLAEKNRAILLDYQGRLKLAVQELLVLLGQPANDYEKYHHQFYEDLSYEIHEVQYLP